MSPRRFSPAISPAWHGRSTQRGHARLLGLQQIQYLACPPVAVEVNRREVGPLCAVRRAAGVDGLPILSVGVKLQHRQHGASSRAPRLYALNAYALRQAHTRGDLTSTVCCFGTPCPNNRLQRNVRAGTGSRTPRRRAALARAHGSPSSYGSSRSHKTRSQSVDRVRYIVSGRPG